MASWLQPKVVGYAGFQSYGVKPYSSNKPGDKDVNDLYAKTRRADDELRYYNNFRRTDNTLYKTEISDNTVPEDYQEVKTIKKGEGQKSSKQFLDTFELGNLGRLSKTTTGALYVSDVKGVGDGGAPVDIDEAIEKSRNKVKFADTAEVTEAEKSQLRSHVEYHKKFLDENTKLVHLKDYSKVQDAINRYNQSINNAAGGAGRLVSVGNSANNSFRGDRTGGTNNNNKGDHPADQSDVIPGGQFVVSLIEDEAEKNQLRQELHLPDNMVPMWRVHNQLYQIYYIPGFNNWMYRKVKRNPEAVHNLSKYKKKFFETLLVNQGESFDASQINGMKRASTTKNADQSNNDHQFSSTVGGRRFNIQKINNQGRYNTSNTRNRSNAPNAETSQSGGLLPRMRPNSVQNFRTVDLAHSQFNQTGFYPSGRKNYERNGKLQRPKDGKMKSGTEFWQTSYQASVVNPWKDQQRDLLIPSLNRKVVQRRSFSHAQNKRTPKAHKGNKNGESGGSCAHQTALSKLMKERRQHPIVGRAEKPRGKKLLSRTGNQESYNAWRKGFRRTQCRTQVTEYNFSFGKLGSNPRSIMPWNSNWKPYVNDPLKYGTTQLTNHIPGYQGFIPEANIHFGKAVEHGRGREPRTTFIKENITENFDSYIPGYAGFKPKNENNKTGLIRDSIFYSESGPEANEKKAD